MVVVVYDMDNMTNMMVYKMFLIHDTIDFLFYIFIYSNISTFWN